MHEIGNAVTLINSSLQMIETAHPEVHSYKYWDTTMEDMKYLRHLLTEVSLYNTSHILSLSQINPEHLLRSTAASFECTNPDIRIAIETENSLPSIKCDQTRLRQVFINLLKNASEALNGIPDALIKLALYRSPDNNRQIILTVTDNGCGMSPEQLETSFLPMVTYKSTGTGLGLSISRKIIEAHGGSLTVTSALHQGTTFTITLPIEPDPSKTTN